MSYPKNDDVDYKVSKPTAYNSSNGTLLFWHKALYITLALVIFLCLILILIQANQANELVQQNEALQATNQAMNEALQATNQAMEATIEALRQQLQATPPPP